MLKDFTYKVDRYGDDISVRYYLSEHPMSVGIIRATTIIDKLNRRCPVIRSTDVGRMVDYIIRKDNIPQDRWEQILMEIKSHAQKLITE